MSKAKLFDYTKAERFAVVRKQAKNRRYYCNFRVLHTDKDEAIAVALKMSKEVGGQYYVVEIQHSTSHLKVRKPKQTAKPVGAETSDGD